MTQKGSKGKKVQKPLFDGNTARQVLAVGDSLLEGIASEWKKLVSRSRVGIDLEVGHLSFL
eukprot:910923-Rhodomonas_salina.1